MGVTIALLYARVSGQEQADEGVSLDAQLSEERRYAARQNWAIGTEYIDIMTGKRDDRPEYQRLLAEVRALRSQGQPAVVVVAALDRFGRRLMERVRSREELKALGVPTHSVREGGEVSDLVANILASVAEEESRRLGERVRASHQYFTHGGWHLIARLPWGYQSRDATPEERRDGSPQKVLDIDPDTAPYVVEAFERVARGESLRAVGRWVANLPASARGDRHLTYSTLRRRLESPLYMAVPPARWPALISAELFARAQAQIVDHQQHAHQATGRYLLSSFLRCSNCGGRVIGTSGGRSRWNRYHYRCSEAANRGRGWCQWTLGGHGADAAVLRVITPLVEGFAAPSLSARLREYWKSQQRPVSGDRARQNRLSALRRDLERGQTQLKRVTALYIDGEIDRAGYELGRDVARAEIEAAETELERTEPRTVVQGLPSIETVLREMAGWARDIQSGDTDVQRGVLALLVDHLTIEHLGRSRYDAYVPHLSWTPLGQALAMLAAELGLDPIGPFAQTIGSMGWKDEPY